MVSGGRSERAFVDVRVFNPFAPSNAAISLSACYKKHENSKKRAYGQRIREIEHASFTPVVMSATGGLAHEATCFYKRLVSLLSHKWGDKYSIVMGWLRCFFVIFLVTLSDSVHSWGPLLDSTLYSGSSTNGFSEGGVQHVPWKMIPGGNFV